MLNPTRGPSQRTSGLYNWGYKDSQNWFIISLMVQVIAEAEDWGKGM